MKQLTQDIKPLTGVKSRELLKNPGRGFRLEVYMEAGTGNSIFEYAGQNAIETLRKEAAKYREESPAVAQVYFYLNHYWDRDIDREAFQRMDAYFDVLEELKLKALLRFAYVYAEDKFDGKPVISGKEPEPERIVKHLEQLKPFLLKQAHRIHALQAGLIGVWGEWDFCARDRMNEDRKQVDKKAGETAVVESLLANTPGDMYLQVRYYNIKSSNLNPDHRKDYDRVGFHDDYLVTAPHVWNTAGGVRGSFDWRRMAEEAAVSLVDGEMIWGASNAAFHGGKDIDAISLAVRLHEHHFTTLSLAHNYRERGGIYSMEHWKSEEITPQVLQERGLPFQPAWFWDENGAPVRRSMFEYIRDYLGYYLAVEKVSLERYEGGVAVGVRIANYGFAAPLALKKIEAVLLNGAGQRIAGQRLCEASQLKPGLAVWNGVRIKVDPDKAAGPFSLAVRAVDEAGTPALLANDVERTKEGQILLLYNHNHSL